MINNTVFSPVGIFFIFLAVSFALYWLGSVIAPAYKKEGGKDQMYACGEDVKGDKKLYSTAAMFFHIALYFTIMDVAALMLATLPHGAPPVLGIFYLLGISTAVFALIIK